jgi:hypothetical protein
VDAGSTSTQEELLQACLPEQGTLPLKHQAQTLDVDPTNCATHARSQRRRQTGDKPALAA